MRSILSIFFLLLVASTIAQPITPGFFSRNDLNDDSLNAEADVLDFLIRLFLGGSRSRGGEINPADLVRVGANFLRALGSAENNNRDEVDVNVRNDAFQDPRVLSFGEEIGRRNQIQQNFRITPNQLAGISRFFTGLLNILR